MSGFRNIRAEKFLASIPTTSLDSATDLLTTKCKFNFAYFTKQDASQSFDDWEKSQLVKLLNKLKEYCEYSLQHWTRQRVGSKNGRVLALYNEYPKKSELTHPAHVPHQAVWGRFRLEYSVRLVGFVVPPEYCDVVHSRTGMRFDCNTFYVVFLDKDHKFFQTEDK